MIQVIRRPGGGWERNADGSKGAKLWQTRHGRRVLTRYGQDNLQDWYDLTIHVPCWEQELANPHHAHNAVPRQTWYPVSEQSLPGLARMIANQGFDVQNATLLPVAVKGWILTKLAGPTTDARGHRVLDVGSDREWCRFVLARRPRGPEGGCVLGLRPGVAVDSTFVCCLNLRIMLRLAIASERKGDG